jgi:hypothetical protein
MQQSPSTRRGRLLVRRLTIIILVAAVSTAIFALPAAAAAPTKTSFSGTMSGVATDVCPFPITVDSTFSLTEMDFVDGSGALTRIYVHQLEQDTFTAHGKSLVGTEFTANYEMLFDSSGHTTHVYADGVVEKIRLPDGSLFISAGRLDFKAHPGAGYILSPDKGNPGNIAGFCAALAP